MTAHAADLVRTNPFTRALAPYGEGYFAPPGSLALESLQQQLLEYKQKVAKRYRFAGINDLQRMLPDAKLLIAPKIDGELWFAAKVGGVTALVAPNGRVLLGVPVALALARALDAAPEALLAGELFAAARHVGHRPRVHHVARALRDPAAAGELGWKAFDVLRWGARDLANEPYAARLALLRSALPESGQASFVQTVEGDRAEVARRYTEWVESERFEGLIVRSDTGFTYKVKPEVSLDAVVIAFGERVTEGVHEVRELCVALVTGDAREYQFIASVGSGLDVAERRSLYARLSASAVASDYRLVNREGMLCRFVRPELVVEMKCADVLPPEPGEAASTKMRLAFDAASGWSMRGAVPQPSVLFPIFVRERPDKNVNVADVGFGQFEQLFGAFDTAEPTRGPPLATPIATTELPRSSVIRRAVWTKAAKGQTAVRKYVAWATNKHDRDPRFPPYVVCFTDFSAGRKEPLQRELPVGATPESLEVHIALWESENLKKGWERAV